MGAFGGQLGTGLAGRPRPSGDGLGLPKPPLWGSGAAALPAGPSGAEKGGPPKGPQPASDLTDARGNRVNDDNVNEVLFRSHLGHASWHFLGISERGGDGSPVPRVPCILCLSGAPLFTRRLRIFQEAQECRVSHCGRSDVCPCQYPISINIRRFDCPLLGRHT